MWVNLFVFFSISRAFLKLKIINRRNYCYSDWRSYIDAEVWKVAQKLNCDFLILYNSRDENWKNNDALKIIF